MIFGGKLNEFTEYIDYFSIKLILLLTDSYTIQKKISVYVHQPNKIMINENTVYIIHYIIIHHIRYPWACNSNLILRDDVQIELTL